jgi:hypothetical protein
MQPWSPSTVTWRAHRLAVEEEEEVEVKTVMPVGKKRNGGGWDNDGPVDEFFYGGGSTAKRREFDVAPSNSCCLDDYKKFG